jgi:hypothetical protein
LCAENAMRAFSRVWPDRLSVLALVAGYRRPTRRGQPVNSGGGPDGQCSSVPKLKKPRASSSEREPRAMTFKPTNAVICACGQTCFTYTSLWCVAIVDAEDAWLLQEYKWSARGSYRNRPFYAISERCSEVHGSEYLHQAVTGHVHSQLDHKNGNGHDCRRPNLQPLTNAENQRKARHGRYGSSRFRGVSWHKGRGKWSAQIGIDGSLKHLGSFAFETDAAIAFNYNAAYLWGEFCPQLNQIPADEYYHE